MFTSLHFFFKIKLKSVLSIHQEVERIRQEHPDDDEAVVKERVKGYLKVTRAFGAGFLKQVKRKSMTKPLLPKLIVCL